MTTSRLYIGNEMWKRECEKSKCYEAHLRKVASHKILNRLDGCSKSIKSIRCQWYTVGQVFAKFSRICQMSFLLYTANQAANMHQIHVTLKPISTTSPGSFKGSKIVWGLSARCRWRCNARLCWGQQRTSSRRKSQWRAIQNNGGGTKYKIMCPQHQKV